MALVLIVDDDPQMLRLLTDVVEMEKHDVLLAQDGAQAIDYFNHQVPDLVITDILMPKKEGLETIMALRRDHPTISHQRPMVLDR